MKKKLAFAIVVITILIGCSSDNTINTPIIPNQTQLPEAEHFKSVSSGYQFCLAIKEDGTLWAWGFNNFGQLGNGTNTGTAISFAAARIGTDSDWKEVFAGTSSAYAIKNDGTLWAWGLNSSGQLGIGTLLDSYIPYRIGTADDNDWKTLCVGTTHVIALKNDGTMWGWGSGAYLGIGVDAVGTVTSPVLLSGFNDWKQITLRDTHSMAIRQDGSLWAWGGTLFGEYGTGFTSTDPYVKVRVNITNDWKYVSVGKVYSMAIKNDGTLWATGMNSSGQLGTGDQENNLSFEQVGTDQDWESVQAGVQVTVALKADHTLWAWGYNGGMGMVGIGVSPGLYVTNPVKISIETDWNYITTGVNASYAVKSNHELWCWGNYLELGYPNQYPWGNLYTTFKPVPYAFF